LLAPPYNHDHLTHHGGLQNPTICFRITTQTIDTTEWVPPIAPKLVRKAHPKVHATSGGQTKPTLCCFRQPQIDSYQPAQGQQNHLCLNHPKAHHSHHPPTNYPRCQPLFNHAQVTQPPKGANHPNWKAQAAKGRSNRCLPTPREFKRPNGNLPVAPTTGHQGLMEGTNPNLMKAIKRNKSCCTQNGQPFPLLP